MYGVEGGVEIGNEGGVEWVEGGVRGRVVGLE